MTRILVVDDDTRLLRALRINLVARGYEVVTATTGTEALRRVSADEPDLVVLDLGLPDLSGADVLAGIRGWSPVPVVMLTARTESQQKVAALDAGADDYVAKPFALEELLARIRVALRHAEAARSAGDAAPTTVTAGDIVIDLGAGTVSRGGEQVHVTPTEWAMLRVLVLADGKLVPQEEILRRVWGPAFTRQRHYLRVYAAQLRRKLEEDPGAPAHLITEPGRGYRFITDGDGPGADGPADAC